MKRLLVLLATASLFTLGASGCGPQFNCASPQHLTGYHGTIQYSAHDFVEQDVWQEVGSQVMDVCGTDNWRATANQTGAPETGVKTYPDSEYRYTDWSTCASEPRIDSFATQTGTYAHVGPDAGSWDAAWDIWLDGSPCNKPQTEIMVLTQWRAVTYSTAQAHPTIAGVDYDLEYSVANHFYQFRQKVQTTEGTVNIKAILTYLVYSGFISPSAQLISKKYGFEVLTTSGVDRDFWLTDFAVTDTLP